jgi:hypothetical protein
VRVFDSAAEWKDDKRRWSRFSSLDGEVVGCGSNGDGDGVMSEADSRTLVGFVSELEGD